MRKSAEVRARLVTGDGALIRILVEAERVGLSLESLVLNQSKIGSDIQEITAHFRLPAIGISAGQITSRFSRYVGVIDVDCGIMV